KRVARPVEHELHVLVELVRALDAVTRAGGHLLAASDEVGPHVHGDGRRDGVLARREAAHADAGTTTDCHTGAAALDADVARHSGQDGQRTHGLLAVGAALHTPTLEESAGLEIGRAHV